MIISILLISGYLIKNIRNLSVSKSSINNAALENESNGQHPIFSRHILRLNPVWISLLFFSVTSGGHPLTCFSFGCSLCKVPLCR